MIITMEKYSKNNVTKVYCTRCDLVFESRAKFEKHLEKHYQISLVRYVLSILSYPNLQVCLKENLHVIWNKFF